MNILETMKQAREALDIYEFQGTDEDARKVTNAITALTQAIEQMEKVEPVAWVNGYYGGRIVIEHMNRASVMHVGMALYAHPAPAIHEGELRAAAQAVVDRWDSPLWSDLPHTGEYIARLRKALEK